MTEDLSKLELAQAHVTGHYGREITGVPETGVLCIIQVLLNTYRE
jgi:hypothetical protein